MAFNRTSGTQTLAVLMNGSSPPTGDSPGTQLYNGTAWATGPSRAVTASNRASSGSATQAETMSAGGYPNKTEVEEFTGPSVITKNITTS